VIYVPVFYYAVCSEFQGAKALIASDASFVADHSGQADRLASVQRFKELEAERVMPLNKLYKKLSEKPYYTGELIVLIVGFRLLLVIILTCTLCRVPLQRAAHGTSAITA
jgi:hypothetical protein